MDENFDYNFGDFLVTNICIVGIYQAIDVIL